MKIQKIQGVITLVDGSTSAFQISTDGGWVQWGAVQARLGETVDVVETMTRALLDDGLIASDSDEDEDERPDGYEGCGCDLNVGHTLPCMLTPDWPDLDGVR